MTNLGGVAIDAFHYILSAYMFVFGLVTAIIEANTDAVGTTVVPFGKFAEPIARAQASIHEEVRSLTKAPRQRFLLPSPRHADGLSLGNKMVRARFEAAGARGERRREPVHAFGREYSCMRDVLGMLREREPQFSIFYGADVFVAFASAVAVFGCRCSCSLGNKRAAAIDPRWPLLTLLACGATGVSTPQCSRDGLGSLFDVGRSCRIICVRSSAGGMR